MPSFAEQVGGQVPDWITGSYDNYLNYINQKNNRTEQPEVALDPNQFEQYKSDTYKYGGFLAPAEKAAIDAGSTNGVLNPGVLSGVVSSADARQGSAWTNGPLQLATGVLGGALVGGFAGAGAAEGVGAGAADFAGISSTAGIPGVGEFVPSYLAEGGLAPGIAGLSEVTPTAAGSAGAFGSGVGAGFQGFPGADAAAPGVTGGAGNTPLDPTGGAATGGAAAGPQYIPAVNQLSPLGTMSTNFGIPGDLAISPAGQGLSIAGSEGAGPIATGGPGLGDFGFTPPGDFGFTPPPGTGTAVDELQKKLKEGGGTALDWITKNPASAAMLGLSAANALSKPKLPEAAQSVQKANTPNLATASGVVNSGGSSGPAWNTQKAAIDSAIDRQIAEKKQQILQQAQNSGMGVDSLVTIQQIQKMTEQMEGMRQQQYMQAQQQNVQAALSEMGMSNAALGQVASQQFAGSKEAQTSAAQTAQLALMLQQLQKPTANQAPANA